MAYLVMHLPLVRRVATVHDAALPAGKIRDLRNVAGIDSVVRQRGQARKIFFLDFGELVGSLCPRELVHFQRNNSTGR